MLSAAQATCFLIDDSSGYTGVANRETDGDIDPTCRRQEENGPLSGLQPLVIVG